MAARRRAPAHFVYIVRCADGTLYTGYTVDPDARARTHNLGKGAKYTASRRPVRLVYVEGCASRGAALSREYAIKRLRRDLKDALLRRATTKVRRARRARRKT